MLDKQKDNKEIVNKKTFTKNAELWKIDYLWYSIHRKIDEKAKKL